MLLRDSMRSRRLEPDSEREQSKRELETEDTVNPSGDSYLLIYDM